MSVKMKRKCPPEIPPNAKLRPVPTKVFEYGNIAASIRGKLESETQAIRQLLVETATNVIQIGLRLKFVRDAIGREHFQAWLAAEFDWSQPTASRYMRVAGAFGHEDCVNRFQPSALYALAKRSVPERARVEALRRARAGEFITQKGAIGMIQECVDRTQLIQPSRHDDAIAATVYRLETRFQKLDPAEKRQFLRHLAALLKRLQNEAPDVSR